jgi:hypothetical protein
MQKIMIAAAAMAFPAAASAMQRGLPQERVDAVVACIDQADPQARLACFDANAAALRQAVQSGAVTVDRRPRVILPVRSTVTASNRSSAGYWRMDLANGQTWQTEESHPTRRPPASGTPITIEGGVFGGYWLNVSSGGRYKVRYLPN